MAVPSVGWHELARAVQVKTVYLSLLIGMAGIAILAISASTNGLWQTVLLSLSITLITSSTFSTISEVMVRLDTLQAIDNRLTDLESRLVGGGASASHGLELVSNRREIDFRRHADILVGDVYICGLSANDILSAEACDKLRAGLTTGRIRSISVVLQDPNSRAARVRSGNPAYGHANSMSGKVRSAIAEVRELSATALTTSTGAVVALYLSKEPISSSLIVDDERAVITPIVRVRTGGTSPTIVVDRLSIHGEWYEIYRSHTLDLISSLSPAPL